MPARVDLPIWAGSTSDVALCLWLDDDHTVPLDVTGSELVWRVVVVGTEVLRRSTPDGVVITSTVGRVEIPISVADTRLLPAGSAARYELEQRIDGIERTLVYGSLLVSVWGGNDDG